MSRNAMCVALVVLSAFAAQAASAETLVDVKKKIESQIDKVQTMRQDVRMTMDMDGPASKMNATSTMEFARRGKDEWVTRNDMTMKTPKDADESGPEQLKMTIIYDGEFMYHISEHARARSSQV